MADQAQARMLSAAFPTPPPYYKHFTKQNVTKVRQIRKEAASNTNQIDVASLPAELRYLIPPEPPADGKYKSFGAQHDLAQPAQSLSQAGIQELYPTDVAHLDPTPHLQTLTRAVLLNFLELVGTLSVNPTQGPEKVEHLQTLFYNLHDLINRYRPHQARESLIMTMEDQLDKIRAQIKGVNSAKDRMQQVLGDI
ncbi:MED7-domain-containing protein, partial [Aureobasidium namibiae CBS 147.97]